MMRPRTSDEDEYSADAGPSTTRRAVLGATGTTLVAAVAGCTAKAQSKPTNPRRTLLSETATVEPNRFEAFAFGLDAERWVTVSAHLSDRSTKVKTDGPSVDVVVMTPEQYDGFENGDAFEYVGGVSMPGVVNGEVSGTLAAGDYVALVDNTRAGDGEPDGSGVTAVVDLDVTATPRRPE